MYDPEQHRLFDIFRLFEKHECYKQIPYLSFKPFDFSLNFCQSIIVFRLVKLPSSKTTCQRVVPKIDFKYAAYQTSLAGIL